MITTNWIARGKKDEMLFRNGKLNSCSYSHLEINIEKHVPRDEFLYSFFIEMPVLRYVIIKTTALGYQIYRNDVAVIYNNQEKYEQAECFCQRALHIRERILGSEHPDTANSLDTLAFIYSNQGKYAEAGPLYQRALHTLTQCLGPQHPNTLEVTHDIAIFQEAQGHKDEAEALYKDVLAVREQILGLSHPKTNETRKRYMSLLKQKSSLDEAPS